MAGILRDVDYVDRLRSEWARTVPEIDTSPAEVVGRVSRIASLLTAHVDEALTGSGLTRGELDLLSALRRADRPMRASEVSTVTQSSGAAITKRTDALDRAGLIHRAVPDRDRRGVLLSLTDEGRATVDRLTPVRTAVERDALADLDPDEAAQLAALLSRVLTRIDRHT
jgi:DNA-binding MarR family transcriptional regulator